MSGKTRRRLCVGAFPLQHLTNLVVTVSELKQGIEKIVELIDTSVNNWRTIQYDPWLNEGPVCLKLLLRLCDKCISSYGWRFAA